MSSMAPGNPAGQGDLAGRDRRSGWGNQELQYYTGEPGNAALDGDGNLAVTVRRADPERARRRCGGCGYTSARLITRGAVRLMSWSTSAPARRRYTGPSTGPDTPAGAASARRMRLAHRRAAAFTCIRSPGTPARSAGTSTMTCITP